MTECWKCNRELAGHWSACPACGALSLANVEAVAPAAELSDALARAGERHDAETVRTWCEETGARVFQSAHRYRVSLDGGGGWALSCVGGRVAIQTPSGGWQHRGQPLVHFGTKLLMGGVPTHVADAMVREARRALGVAS